LTPLPQSFACPSPATALFADLSRFAKLTRVSSQRGQTSYYDSFDWRLYQKGICCELTQTKTAAWLTLSQHADGQTLARADLTPRDSTAPLFTEHCPASLRPLLEPILSMRALLNIGQIACQCHQTTVVDTEDKVLVRLVLEEYQDGLSRLWVAPLKGYEKAARQFIGLLTNQLHLQPYHAGPLPERLTCQPGSYTGKLDLALNPAMRADTACKDIYRQLHGIISANEQGVIHRTDSEFLHDFRVAVRKTRAGISQLNRVLPKRISRHYAGFFAELGRATSPVRDMDVYLLDFDGYKNALPLAIRADLEPLRTFLLTQQAHWQQELATTLASTAYTHTLTDWAQFLQQPTPQALQATHPDAHRPIKQVTDQRIDKLYHRALREGKTIRRDSPADNFHTLRKTCKKLRYLMEFFQTLYPTPLFKELLKKLKNLQEILGTIQDCQVQANYIRQFQAEPFPAPTQLALTALLQLLAERDEQARAAFTDTFAEFTHCDQRRLLAKH